MQIMYFADIRFPLERANGIQTFRTCQALARRGHHVRLIVRPDTARPPRDPFEYYGEERAALLDVDAVAVLGPPAMRRAMWLLSALRRAAGARDAEAAITRDLGLASLLVRLPRGRRAPVVYESHGFAPLVGATLDDMLTNGHRASGAKQDRLGRREARVWQRADGYVTITRILADELEARFGRRAAVAVVPDGVQVGQATSAPAIVRHRPAVVGYAGHLYPWKGVDVLLAALALLEDVRGVIVGGFAAEPDLDRTRARAAALGVHERVTFTGAVPPAQVPQHLAEMDILVLPNTATHVSSRYTSPLKLFEYMAAGRPIVASDLPALGEVLRHEENALLVAPGSAEAIAEAVRRLSRDTALADRLAMNAWRDVQAYSWDRRAALLEDVLARAAAAHVPGADGANV